MAKSPKPYTVICRKDAQTFRITLNPSCGLPERVCRDWYRRSLQHLPEELSAYRNPRRKSDAEAVAVALIVYLKQKQSEGTALRVRTEDITVRAWLKKFTELETNPRAGLNAARNRPYSYNTLDGYKSFYECHIKNDPICNLKMAEVEEEDILEFISRLIDFFAKKQHF